MIGVLGLDSRRGLGIFLFTTTSRTALGPTQPPIQRVPGALSLGVKRPGREADHWLPSSAEVKEWVELCLHYSNTPSWRGAQLKHRDNFTFNFYNKDAFCLTVSSKKKKANNWSSTCFVRCETSSLTLREEHRLRVFENRVLRRMFAPKRQEMAEGWGFIICTLHQI
jgi:hypothetical protein